MIWIERERKREISVKEMALFQKLQAFFDNLEKVDEHDAQKFIINLRVQIQFKNNTNKRIPVAELSNSSDLDQRERGDIPGSRQRLVNFFYSSQFDSIAGKGTLGQRP